MRRMGLRRAVWVLVVFLAAAGIATAQSPSARRVRLDMPERLGPPIVVTPLDVNKAPGPITAEVGTGCPARPVPGSVSIVMSSHTRWCWLFPAPHPVPIPAVGSRP
jgi:hypothetical protein